MIAPKSTSEKISGLPTIAPGRNCTLDQWLRWLENLHPVTMDLELERVASVAKRAGLMQQLPLLISVAGTNGKGSVVTYLRTLYHAAGYRTGSYTSPHIVRFNERICIGLETVTDAVITAALDWVESFRGDTSLTYFEFTTLAAMRIFCQQKLDVAILEVGLGGRLDAVNVWDTDCAVITSIAFDHQAWLGDNLSAIGFEKAGIARAHKPLVLGQPNLPDSIHSHASELRARVWECGRHFRVEPHGERWRLIWPHKTLSLSKPALPGSHQIENAATALTVAEVLQKKLPVDYLNISEALAHVSLPGRFEQCRYADVDVIMDVAHNPAAAAALCKVLMERLNGRRGHAVFGIMRDKDIDLVVESLAPCIDSWHCVGLSDQRAVSAVELSNRVAEVIHGDTTNEIINTAYAGAADAFAGAIDRAKARESDYVLVFGSFHTVSAITSVFKRANDTSG